MLVTDQCTRVGFGPFVQQHFGHAVVAAVCRHVQRGKVVQCDVINLCVVLQELLDAVHVVPLCCHVDWRQAILQKKEKVLTLSSLTKREATCLVMETNNRSKKRWQEGSMAVWLMDHTLSLSFT